MDRAVTLHRIRPPSSSRPDCSTTAEVPSSYLPTALSAIPFVFERWGVHVQWFQDKSSQALPNSRLLSVWMTFGFLVGSRNFIKSPAKILFTRVWLYPLCCQVLYHHGISMIMSRLTSFIEICCYWITKNPFWARLYQHVLCSPCNFWFSSRCRNFDPSGIEWNILCIPDTTSARGSEADSQEELVGVSLRAGTLSSTRFSINSSNHSGRSRNGSHRTPSLLLVWVFGFYWSTRRVSPYSVTRTLTSCWWGMQNRKNGFLV